MSRSERDDRGPLIQLKNACLGYGKKVILKDISLAIRDGDFFGVVGPNGSGKTTLLRAILGTIRPLSGQVERRGSDFRAGYVPQRGNVDDLLPFTSGEVVMMGRQRDIGLFRSPREPDHRIVSACLRSVGIEGLYDVPFKKLSGGQKQRVLIARALASRPTVLILDEPTNGMDLPSRWATLSLIRRLHDEERLTIIIVTHHLDDVAHLVTSIALLDQRGCEVGEVETVLTEKNLSAVYQMPIRVRNLEGAKVITPGGPDAAR
jgi:ABC-type Mn2+/Zn2+ transport system ATPase subunit